MRRCEGVSGRTYYISYACMYILCLGEAVDERHTNSALFTGRSGTVASRNHLIVKSTLNPTGHWYCIPFHAVRSIRPGEGRAGHGRAACISRRSRTLDSDVYPNCSIACGSMSRNALFAMKVPVCAFFVGKVVLACGFVARCRGGQGVGAGTSMRGVVQTFGIHQEFIDRQVFSE